MTAACGMEFASVIGTVEYVKIRMPMERDVKSRLLIVDTESFDREMMDRVFGTTYTVKLAKDVCDAKKVMKSFEPAVVFYEIRKNDAKQIDELFNVLETKYPGTAIIVSVSDNTRELEMKIRSRKLFYYMLRPFNLKELWDAVESGCKYYDKSKKLTINPIPNKSEV